jgi:transcriptional regulator GlxA family with amidase domain
MNSVRSIGVILFPQFELLDVFGPLEMFGAAPDKFSIHMVAEKSGYVASRQGPKSVVELDFGDDCQFDILLVPGGPGTRAEVNNAVLLQWLREQSEKADYVASVCTGSALLAKAGVLNGFHATTNKRAFEWATAQSDQVTWVKEARWVEDRNVFTSSGVSAGMDMSLALISKLLGPEVANEISNWTEYEWHRDAGWDPFAAACGLVST